MKVCNRCKNNEEEAIKTMVLEGKELDLCIDCFAKVYKLIFNEDWVVIN